MWMLKICADLKSTLRVLPEALKACVNWHLDILYMALKPNYEEGLDQAAMFFLFEKQVKAVIDCRAETFAG